MNELTLCQGMYLLTSTE